jgi:hypothetical protein
MAEHRQNKSPQGPSDSDGNGGGKLRALFGGILGPLSRIGAMLQRMPKRTRTVVAVLAILAVVHVVVFAFWVPAVLKTEAARKTSLPAAVAALDRNSLIEARRLATILYDGTSDASERGGPLFVIGAALAGEAESAKVQDQKTAYKKAADTLTQAQVRGFPAGREAQGWYLLGKSLCLAGVFDESRLPLEEAAKFNPPFRADVFELLATANSNGADVQLLAAQKHIER